MKKPLIIVGFLLTLAFVLNMRITMNQAKSTDISLTKLLSSNIALAEDDGRGIISIRRDCEEPYYACNPWGEDCQWYTCYGETTHCLLGWPNLGCNAESCLENCFQL